MPIIGVRCGLELNRANPATIIAGQQDDVLRIVASHRGRTDDTEAELATFELLFEESACDPLTPAEANSLIENLHIARQRKR